MSEEFGGHKDPGSLPQREGKPVEPEICDTCIHGRGDFINDGEKDDFYCHNEKVPYDKRIHVVPDTPACKHYLLVIRGYRARMAIYQQERRKTYSIPPEDPETVIHFGGMTFGTDDLTDRQHRDDLEEDRQHDKGLR